MSVTTTSSSKSTPSAGSSLVGKQSRKKSLQVPTSNYVGDVIEPIGHAQNEGADHTDNLGDNASSNLFSKEKEISFLIEGEGLPTQMSTTQVQVHEKVEGMRKV